MDKSPRRPGRKKSKGATAPAAEALLHTPIMAELYRRAEVEVKKLPKSKPAAPDPRKLLHELQVHQVELEMQNSTLQEAQELLQHTLERYTDLHDFAPVAYFTLDLSGAIDQVNHAGARLVGIDRVHLVGRAFSRCLVPSVRKRFDAFLLEAFDCETTVIGEFDLLGVTSDSRTVSIDAQVAANRTECRLVAIDITERKLAEATRLRVEVLAATNRKLELEIVRREKVERSLRASERKSRTLLSKSKQLQNELRRLSHLIIETEEEERRRISRELHDDITQTLININFHLASLSSEAEINPRVLKRKISRTQKLVEESVEIVHDFARDLRPPALDHLGLIPALETLVSEFISRTKIKSQLKIFPEIESVDNRQRIVIYRVVQSALSNVAKHSQAKNVVIEIQKVARHVRLTVADDGKSFDARRLRYAKHDRRLGLLGMRERIEMVGGSFEIQGQPGKGTSVEARIPMRAKALKAAKPRPEKVGPKARKKL